MYVCMYIYDISRLRVNDEISYCDYVASVRDELMSTGGLVE